MVYLKSMESAYNRIHWLIHKLPPAFFVFTPFNTNNLHSYSESVNDMEENMPNLISTTIKKTALKN